MTTPLEFRHFNYGFSNAAGTSVYIWKDNSTWEQIGTNADEVLTGIPLLSKITSNASSYSSGGKVYVLVAANSISTLSSMVTLSTDSMKLKAFDNTAPIIMSAIVSSNPSDKDISIEYIVKDADADLVKAKLEYSTDN